MATRKTFGDVLSKEIDKQGWTMTAFASHVPCEPHELLAYRKGIHYPSIFRFVRRCEILDLNREEMHKIIAAEGAARVKRKKGEQKT